jgi:hypothetical protein
MCRTFSALFLAAACLLLWAPPAEAGQPYRDFPSYSAVYVQPQIVTSPYAYGWSPYGYSYYPSWSAWSQYNPGFYRYWYSPFGGASYYYRNPSYYSWYWIR